MEKVCYSTARTVLVNGISVRTGGAQTFLAKLIPRLATMMPDWTYHLIIQQSCEQCVQGLGPNVTTDIVPNERIDTILNRLKFEHYEIPRLHRKNNYSLHFQIDEMLSPVVSAMRVPSIVVFHTTPMVMFDGSTGDRWLFRQYARQIRHRAAKNATLPIAVSHHAKAELAGLFPFARDRLRVVYHGVDLTHFSPGPVKVDFNHHYDVIRPFVLSISNRFEWKNYYRLVQAYHKLVQTHQVPFDLLLVGEAKKMSEEARIAAYINEHSLSERIHLLDFVTQADLLELYRAAQVYVFPSMRETFGLTVLEAMACGTPVACARWGPLPEIAGDAAYYFDPLSIDDMAEAVFNLSESVDLQRTFQERGLQHVKYFTWERTSSEYVSLMHKILDGNQTR